MILRSRALRLVLVFTLLVAFGVLVMPAGLWFGQRDAIAEAKAQLTELKEENAGLEARVTRLRSRDVIEIEAHEFFGLVYPGDELYTITPEPQPIVNLPRVWPFNRVQETLAAAAASR